VMVAVERKNRIGFILPVWTGRDKQRLVDIRSEELELVAWFPCWRAASNCYKTSIRDFTCARRGRSTRHVPWLDARVFS
jgi:hypothetical protein